MSSSCSSYILFPPPSPSPSTTSILSLSLLPSRSDVAQLLLAPLSPTSSSSFSQSSHLKPLSGFSRAWCFSKPFETNHGLRFGVDATYASEQERFSYGRGPSFPFNNDQLNSSSIGVGFDGNQRVKNTQGFGYSQAQKGDFQNRKLFVGNLPWSADKERLEDLFREAGTVELVEVVVDRITGRNRGFGFVTMRSVDEAEAAVSKLDGYALEGRFLKVSISSRKSGGASLRSNVGVASGNSTEFAPPEVDELSQVFVGNLSWGVDDIALENMFISYGEVLEAKIVYDRESGRSKGFGFVTLSSPSEASAAISRLNGTNHDGRPLRVNLAKDRPGPRY